MNSLFSLARSNPPSIKARQFAALSKYRRRVSSTTSLSSPSLERTTNTSSSSNTSSKATEDTIALDGTVDNKSTVAAHQCLRPRPLFPWRSSPDHLPRLVQPAKPSVENSNDTEEEEIENITRLEEYYESDYFTKGGPLGSGWPTPSEPWFRGMLYANSMSLLGISWPSIIMPWTRKDWEHDMEWGFCHAFSSGVSGMVEGIYALPGNDSSQIVEKDTESNSESFDVNVDISLDPVPLVEMSEDNEQSSKKSSDVVSEKDEYNMIQQNLRQLYQSANEHSHPSKINIVLKTAPQSAQIESMFPVFGLSRSMVEDHPHLRHTYRNMMKRLQEKNKEAVQEGRNRLNPVEVGNFFYEGLSEVMERSAELSDDGQHACITIIAQVSINCKEIFCVRDVESGDIIQGYSDGEPRNVTHLVRFEMVVREKLATEDEDGDWEIELGRWQITDWDDLCDGNVFFT